MELTHDDPAARRLLDAVGWGARGGAGAAAAEPSEYNTAMQEGASQGEITNFIANRCSPPAL